MFKVGDKIVPIKPGQFGCGNLNSYANDVEYVLVTKLASDGSIDHYEGWDENGNRLTSCYNCLRARSKEYKLYNQGITTVKTTQYKAGDKINITDVAVAFSDGPRAADVGDKFVLVQNQGEYGLAKFTIVEMNRNDGTGAPSFVYNGDGNTRYMRWCDLAEIPASLLKDEKPVVTNTATYYSDGVKVTETNVEFDGKNWEREELEKTIKRYQEILRRPVAQVAVPTPVAPKVPAAKKSTKTTK